MRQAMKPDQEWQAEVKGMLRAEMTRRGITYDQLSSRLAEIGVKTDPHVLRNKVARGGFSAVFFVQCLRALGCRQIVLDL
jgi:3-mercaptopyruvate sulfurtransferase SseA